MKKVFSLILCAVILFCAAVPTFADHEGCDCGFSPIIYVGPLGCTPIVRDAGTENEQQLWKIDTRFLLANLSAVLPRLNKAILLRNPKLLGDALVEFVYACFGDLALEIIARNIVTPVPNMTRRTSITAFTSLTRTKAK